MPQGDAAIDARDELCYWPVAALHRVGLADAQAHAIASGLTTKQLRLMELARALAPRPKLLLLDETLAGLGDRASLVGDVVDYEGVYRLCYVRGPEGILVGLAEELG